MVWILENMPETEPAKAERRLTGSEDSEPEGNLKQNRMGLQVTSHRHQKRAAQNILGLLATKPNGLTIHFIGPTN